MFVVLTKKINVLWWSLTNFSNIQRIYWWSNRRDYFEFLFVIKFLVKIRKLSGLRFNLVFFLISVFCYLIFLLSVTTAPCVYLSTYLHLGNLFQKKRFVFCAFVIRHRNEIIEKHRSLFKLVVIWLKEEKNLVLFVPNQ